MILHGASALLEVLRKTSKNAKKMKKSVFFIFFEKNEKYF